MCNTESHQQVALLIHVQACSSSIVHKVKNDRNETLSLQDRQKIFDIEYNNSNQQIMIAPI